MEEEIKKNFEKLPTPFLVVDGHFSIIYINKAGKLLLEFNEKNPVLTGYAVGTNDVLKILDCFKEMAEGKENSTLEFLIEKEGVKTPIKGELSNYDEASKTVQIVLTDLTPLKTLEQEVRNKGTYLDTVLEGLYDGITIADGQGHIRHVNEKALSISGLKKEDIVGKWAIDLFQIWDDAKDFVDSMMGLLSGNTNCVKGTYKFVKADGSPVDVELTVKLLDDKQGYVAFTREV